MGCANSKVSTSSRQYKHSSGSMSPTRRSITLFPRYHLESGRHVSAAAKTSVSFVDTNAQQIKDEEERKDQSGLMDERIPKIVPKTPIRTPPGEPENVNLWEVMAGLEDTSPLIRPAVPSCNSFSFTIARNAGETCQFAGTDSPVAANVSACTEPKWLEMTSDEKDSIPEFDPEIISMFRHSLEHPSHEQWQAKCKKQRVVIYFTSLRGIRKTYEDCCQVRMILKGLKLRVDEKDVSMHSGFKQDLLSSSFGGGLPKVFIGEKYIGDADEIRRLHEEGELEKLLEECEMTECNGYGCNTSCEACGDIRLIPCETCSGSCKIFHDYDEDDKQDMADEGFGFRRCSDCNENGLIRCPLCCD